MTRQFSLNWLTTRPAGDPLPADLVPAQLAAADWPDVGRRSTLLTVDWPVGAGVADWDHTPQTAVEDAVKVCKWGGNEEQPL